MTRWLRGKQLLEHFAKLIGPPTVSPEESKRLGEIAAHTAMMYATGQWRAGVRDVVDPVGSRKVRPLPPKPEDKVYSAPKRKRGRR